MDGKVNIPKCENPLAQTEHEFWSGSTMYTDPNCLKRNFGASQFTFRVIQTVIH